MVIKREQFLKLSLKPCNQKGGTCVKVFQCTCRVNSRYFPRVILGNSGGEGHFTLENLRKYI